MNVTSLSLAVDSSQVNSASQALDRFAAASKKAESASTRMERAHAAMLAEMRGIAHAVPELLKLAAAQSGATVVAQKMASANIAAASASNKASAAFKQEAQTIQSSLTPAATKGAAAVGKLSLAGDAAQTAGIKAISAELSAAATQAARTVASLGAVQAKAASISFAPTAGRAAVAVPARPATSTAPAIPGAPVASGSASAAIATYTANATSARSAIDRLTASAKSQASALGALAPAAAATATSYRAIAAAPIKVEPPAGLNSTTTVLRSAAEQVERLRTASATLAAARPTVPTPAATPANTAAATAASRVLAQAHNDQARSARLAAFQQQQLGFQLHDFFVQVTSGQSPLTAFVQQGSQLSGTFGGAGNAFRAVLNLITPARVAIGGLAGAVAGLGYAYYEGSKQSKAFADSLVLTGNFSGQTEGRFNELAKSIAQGGQVTVAAGREAAQAVLATGAFGPTVYKPASQAVALFAEATDKSADDVAKSFAEMSRSPSKFATEINKTYHVITAKQYDLIKSFEDQGKAADANGIIFDALNSRLKNLDPNLGTIERTLRSAKNTWKDFWDAALDVGRTETISDKLAKVNRQIEERKGARVFEAKVLNRPDLPENARDRELAQQRSGLARDQRVESEAADRKAIEAQTQEEGIAAKGVVDSYLRRSKAASEYKTKLDELNRSFKAREEIGSPVSKADQATAVQQLQKDFINPEAQQVLRAGLDRDLKSIQDIFQAERDALDFQNRYVQGAYQEGQISLETLFKSKRDTAQRGVDVVLDALNGERARLEQHKRETKDPSDRTQTQTRIDEIDTQKKRVIIEGQREQVLINQDDVSSFKALNEQIDNYRANLLQLEGDEAGAAKIRAQIAIRQAQQLAQQAKAQGAAPVDVGAMARATLLVNGFNDAQRRAQLISAAAATSENAFVLAMEQRGSSLRETEQGVYAIRAAEVEQLGQLVVKAKELAETSTDPRIAQFAADLAARYAKALAEIDPALNRLRDANRQLAADLANTVTNLPQTFADAYARRRQQSLDDITNQKSEFDHRIDILEGYLAESQDKQDKARLRAKIKDLQSQKDNAKGSSRVGSLFGAVNDALIQPAGQQIASAATKLLISDPLQKLFENQLKSITGSDNTFGKALREALGVKVDPKEAALAAQTAAITSSTTALSLLEAAARGAADGISSRGVASPGGSVTVPTIGPDAESGDAVDAFGAVVEDSTRTTADFARIVPTASDVITKLAVAGGSATQSLALLPSIISLISASATTNAAASSGGGIFSAIAGLFKGSGSGSTSTFGGAGIFHEGGIVGSPSQTRYVASSMFQGAQRYHTGGLIGRKADGLKHGEVPAILLPDEEVLKRSDPRHRHNLASGIFAAVQQAEKHSGSEVRDLFARLGVKRNAMSEALSVSVQGNREIGGPVSAGGMYRVNERGPELLQVAGRQYLMMGNQAGKVEPTGGSAKSETNINQHFNFNTNGQPIDRRTVDQLATAANMGARRATTRNS